MLHKLLDALAFLDAKARQLTIGILDNVGTSKEVLLELNDGKHVLGKDASLRAARSKQLI